MRESVLGQKLFEELRVRGWKVFKLHNDALQRGLPDAVLWRDRGLVLCLELKVASSLNDAREQLTPGQLSVFESLARTGAGALLVYGAHALRADHTKEWRGGVYRRSTDEVFSTHDERPCAAYHLHDFIKLLCDALEEVVRQ